MAEATTHYTVLARDKTGWQSKGQWSDMPTAVKTAEDLFKSNSVDEVKVDQEFIDGFNKRHIVGTILNKKRSSSAPAVPLLAWILIAMIGGVVSFGLTYFVVTDLLGVGG